MTTGTSYRCLYSSGFQFVVFNGTIDEFGMLKAGLVRVPGGLCAMPLRLKDIDSDKVVGRVDIPEEICGYSSLTWLDSPIDDLEFEVLPL